MHPALAMLLLVAPALAACSRQLDDSSPEGAAARFLDAIERSEHDRAALEEAYRLLDSESRRRLAERARSASALGAREYEPWEMIVEGRAMLRFQPRRGGGLRARPPSGAGDAIVAVIGEDGSQRAEIPMRHETEGWRVVLSVPDVAARGRGRPGVHEQGGADEAPARSGRP